MFGDITMENKNLIGTILALVGGIFGTVGTFLLFTNILGIPGLGYLRMMAAEAEAMAPGCQIMVGLILPIVSDLGIIAGVLYFLCAYGFVTNSRWAFPSAVIANVIALVASFWPMIPAMATGLPPAWGIVFVPNLIIYFILLIYVGEVNWSRTLLGLLSGIAYVMSFLNGVAATNRMTILSVLYQNETHFTWPIFVALERLNWVGAALWGLTTIGLILRPSENIRILGMGAAIIEVVAGLPLGIVSSINELSSFGSFSLFLPAPILSLLLLVIFAYPKLWHRIVKLSEEEALKPVEASLIA
jgi:hypothetical protein